MSYRDESALLARELAYLAATGSTRMLNPGGLDVALAGRSETLRLLRRVLADTTGISRNDTGADQRHGLGGVRRSVEELEAHPVAMLSRMLATHPAPRPQAALSDMFIAQTGQGDVGAAKSWAEAARRALLAGHEWSTRQPQPDPDQQWSAVADVAALAQVVTVLDRHLHTAARNQPDVDPALVEALQAASTSGLRSAASQAAALAAAGPLPEWGEPGSQPSSARLLLVRSPADVVSAQDRIAAQVTAATDLSPQAVTLLATGQVRVLTAAAAALANSDPQRAARATELARHLTAGVAGGRQLASLTPDDPRPVAQTRELLQHLSAVSTRGWATPAGTAYQAALAAAVDRSPAVVRALSERADQSVRSGQWLMVNTEAERPGDLLWRRATRQDPEPRLCTSLSAVAARATAIPAATTTPSTPAAAPAPRHTLAGVLNLDRPTRPHRPGQRPQPDTGRD